DARKATTIVSMLEDYPVEIAVLVQDSVIDDAGTQTHSQLIEALKKAVIALSHDDADLFHARARARRRVEHPRQLPDGMACIRAVLPATDAAAIDLALQAAARSAQASGDDRTLDQLRADILSLMGHTALELGYVGLPPGTTPTTEQPALEPVPDRPATLEPMPGEPAAPEPMPGEPAAPEPMPGEPAAPEPMPGEPAAPEPMPGQPAPPESMPDRVGIPEHDPSPAPIGPWDDTTVPSTATVEEAPGAGAPVAFPGRCTPAAEQGDAGRLAPPGSPGPDPAPPDPPDHRPEGTGAPTVGSSTTAAPPEPPEDPSPPGSAGTIPRRWHMPVGHIGGQRAQIRVLVPLSVLLPPDIARQLGLPASRPADGSSAELAPLPEEDAMLAFLNREPADVAVLEGYGPISPAVARAAALGGTWRRIVTDPLTGTVLDHGRTRYRPPNELAELIRLRDGTCVRAGCTHTARRCQLDHTVPWNAGGTTSMLGLEDLCTHDHILKTSGQFQLRRLGSGAYEWVTPSGHIYRRHPGGRVTRERRRRQHFADSPTF
ncbi:DUF222 domain-containing protein, partial [Georgenia satyanarayanai]|uniref:HNH endonuclease signature motif containing protein n=1 Tax=Georgenia satyanarayanai TaxID=860221 RepID=UPI00204001AC